MKIVGIDQSIRSTGICVFEDGKLVYATRAVSEAKTDHIDRLLSISKVVVDICKDADYVFFEDLPFAMKSPSIRILAALLMHMLIELRDKKCTLLNPSTVKKFATGHGAADKSMMLNSIHPDEFAKLREFNGGVLRNIHDMGDAYHIGRLGQKIVEAGIFRPFKNLGSKLYDMKDLEYITNLS